jgi:hypothetical protein
MPLLYEFPGITDFVDIHPSKTKLLIVDNKTRRIGAVIDSFKQRPDFTISTSVKHTLRKLAEEDWDLVSLEHDLNESFENPDSTTSGMEIVRYIEKTGWPANKPKPRIHVHSHNIFAAYLMVTRLNAMGFCAEWEPFKNDYSEVA